MGAGATACNKKFASWNGYTKYDGRVQKYIVSDYNKRTGRHLNCKTTPYCQIAAIEAQLQSKSVKRAYITSGCKQSKAWYVKNKRWKSRGVKPVLGWQVFYCFPNKKGKRSKTPGHTGVIYGLKGAYMYVREGNMGAKGRVGGRKIKYKSADVQGFGVPYYK